ncbi:MAG: DUF4279 domain-containing protein [Pseudomonadota bacterium]
MAGPGNSTASLRLFGDDLDPEEITDILGCSPTGSHKKDEERFSRRTGKRILDAMGRPAVWKTGSWRLSTGWRGPGDLEAQIWELLRKVADDVAIWQSLASRYQGDVFCGWQMNSGNEGVFLPPPLLQALGERRLALNLDVYGTSEEDEA